MKIFKQSKRVFFSILVCSSFIFLSSSNGALADVSENQAPEVAHLINFVKTSDCMLNRNGSEHAGEKSAAHIEKKYNYFRDKIKSTEDFIMYSATKSTISGKFYTVSCPGKAVMKTQDWLLEELERFRSLSK